MRLLIELPTWLGDTIMATGAIENLVSLIKPKYVAIVGSIVSVEAIKNAPYVDSVYTYNKNVRNIIFDIYRLTLNVGEYDIAISFRSHFFSKLLLFLIKTKKRYTYQSNFAGHQAEQYNHFINSIFNTKLKPRDLKLYYKPKKYGRITIGINPGAAYGSAKRWYPEYFAQVINYLSRYGDTIIFGGPDELQIADDIQSYLTIDNYKNLAGKTSVASLIEHIAGLSLLITNDSGPMHVAASYKIPTVALFGPTNHKETSPYNNPLSVVLRKDLACSPCFRRHCPIKTHDCMKLLLPNEVIDASLSLLDFV